MSDHFDERAICHGGWQQVSGGMAIGCLSARQRWMPGRTRILFITIERMAVFKAEVYNSADRKLAEAYGSRLAAVEPARPTERSKR